MPISTKQELRKKYKQLRLALSESQASKLSEQIAQNFINNIQVESGNVVAGYYPVNNEADSLQVLNKIRDLSVDCALPRIHKEDHHLKFYKWQIDDDLVKSDIINVLEPKVQNQEVFPDIIIVPLLAFDKSLHRLGYGGGYYDRTIDFLKSQNKKFQAIGIAYDFQHCEYLPTNTHDHSLDAIITNKEVFS